MSTAFIAIGTNMGDRSANMALARRELAALPESRLEAFSTVRETAPVGPVSMGAFLNAVAKVETSLEPTELLRQLNAIEQRAGRVRTVRWGPRTLDLDLLLYGDWVIHTDELTVPHPRLHERPFVLEPLAELAPDVRHPKLGRTVAELLAQL